MTVLAITNLILRIAGRDLLNGANLSVPPGAKIGLVGRNGAASRRCCRPSRATWSPIPARSP